MSEDAILDYIDSKPFTKNLIQSKWQNNSMVLVLLLNGLMVMVTRFSTVILCLAAGISILFLVLYWRFCRSSTELRRALFYGGSVIAYLAVLFAVILAWLVREHFAEVPVRCISGFHSDSGALFGRILDFRRKKTAGNCSA